MEGGKGPHRVLGFRDADTLEILVAPEHSLVPGNQPSCGTGVALSQAHKAAGEPCMGVEGGLPISQPPPEVRGDKAHLE